MYDKDEERRHRELEALKAKEAKLREELASLNKEKQTAKSRLLSMTRHENWHVRRLAALDMLMGYVGEMASARIYVRSLSLDDYVAALRAFAILKPGADNLSIEIAAVKANHNEWHRLGEEIVLERERQAAEADRASWEEWRAKNPEHNALHFIQYKAQLQRHKVKIVSITQSFGNDPASELAVGMLALFDEYHSAENSKHVKRTMIANAANGYWNGQTPPLGYHTVTVPQAKGKDRKRLEIDPATAHVARFIFDTYVNGDANGPVGITRLAHILNARGERIGGKPFHVSNVHGILCNSAYIGFVIYNRRDSRTGDARPEDEWVPIPVPTMISEDLFYAARAQMAARDPKMGGAAEKTNTNLLIGRAVCGCGDDGCGSSMTTATGKSGAYRYYACQRRSNSGATECTGRRIRMETLDDIVVSAVVQHVLEPTRLNALLQAFIERSDEAKAGRREQLKQLRTRMTLLEAESANVIKLVRLGRMAADDPQIETELGNIAAQKRALAVDIATTERQLDDGGRRITPEVVARFGDLIASKLRDPKMTARRDYLRLIVDRVEVGRSKIRISGSKRPLSQVAMGVPPGMMPKAERKWCTQSDSNARPSDS